MNESFDIKIQAFHGQEVNQEDQELHKDHGYVQS
jgi:hypothetical protein